jgi:ASC-1-like (ASCH) protein
MWNLISCKSSFKEYLKQKEDQKLSKCISAIKPLIDTSRPKTKSSKYLNKVTTSRVKNLREKQINAENKSLLQRMLRIDLKAGKVEKKITEVASMKSLNKNFRLKQLEDIHNTNKNMTKRLKSTGSVYSLEKWEESNKFHEYIRDNISRNSGRVGKRKIIDADRKIFQDFQGSMENSFEEFLNQNLEGKKDLYPVKPFN